MINLLTACLVVSSFRGLAAPEAAGKRMIQPFDYHNVQHEDGPLKRQFDETRDYYLRIPNDDLLKGFRARAGKPAPGVDLGGWYTGDVFHVFGQILSGLARMYAASGDPACKEKADALLHEWGQCIEPDGFFFYSRKPNARHYIYDKMVGGLVDMIRYCYSKEAKGYLNKITDWAIKNLDRTRPYGADPNEWYTLSENLYRAYLETGDVKYRNFAKVWEYTDYWNAYAERRDIFAPRADGKVTGAYHAYSHVNTLGGAGAAYLVTGEKHYLDTLVNAYDYLQANQCFATGGYGPNEQLLPRAGLVSLLGETHNTFETQCGSWAAFKMCKYLLSFTGDAEYGDWIERLVINGIGASIPMSADGRVFYYSDYCTAGASKQQCGFGWSCCAGTRPMAVADFHDLIYFHDGENLYVNLYTPSRIEWDCKGTHIRLRQFEGFPEGDTIYIGVDPSKQTQFNLKLRVPGWVSGPIVAKVNDQEVEVKPDAHHWITIRRIWHKVDQVKITLPVGFQSVPLDPDKPYPTAITRGPVVMAFHAASNPTANIPLANLNAAFTESPGEPLTYHLAADPTILVRPFYALKEGEPYYLYLDPAAVNRITHRQVTFSPNWNDAGSFRFSNVVGATAEVTFEGTGIRWRGFRYDDSGIAEVRIDGQVVATVDQYGPGRDLPFDWKHEGLPFGKHTIKITVLPDKNPASKDRYLNVAGFEVMRPDVPAR